MNLSSWCLVFLLLLGCAFSSEEVSEASSDVPSDVLELDGTSFPTAIAEHPLIAVEFFSPWCGHCKSLAPEWEKAATELKGKVPVAKVDCTANQDLCNAQEVQGYPTLKLFRDGEAAPMEVARKAEAIVFFLTKEMEPAVTMLADAAAADEWVAAHPNSVVGYLDNDHDDRFLTFRSVANKKKQSVDFAAVLKSDEPAPKVVLHRNFEAPNKLVYSGELVAAAPLALWISKNLLPTLGEISGETFPSYMAAEPTVLGYLFVDPNDASTAPLLKELEPKLAPYKDDFVLAWIDNNKYAQQAQRLGLSSKIPSLALDNPVEGIRYIFPEDQTLTAESLGEWFAQFKAGSLKPHVKSEDIPESNDGPVKVLVAHTFKEIVYDKTKDVLVEFYAPWCGHCKTLAPTWEQLGSLFKDVESVVIAKIDATANDVPPKLNIRGFPTIIYFPGNKKDTPVEYQGLRGLDDLARFVRQNAQVSTFPAEAEDKKDEDDHDHEHEADDVKDEL